MKSIALVLLAIFLSNFQTKAQQFGRIEGTVFDAVSQESLPGVNVVLQGKNIGTSTNENGKFLIENLEEGKYSLIFSFIGYARYKLENVQIESRNTAKLDTIKLEEEAFSLNQITVTPGSFSIMGDENLSRQTLTQKDLKNMSWAEDITRAVARLPGISSSDFSSKFTIRGGESDEVLITLDGMELYEPFHQRDYSGGLFSIVDIETIQGIELMTGGFSAENGNRMSGVFNMRTKNIADNQSHTSMGLSVLNGRFYTDGKLSDNKVSYIISARRSMLDLLFKAVGATENLPSFYDAMAKLEFELNPKHSLSFHALQAGDKTKIRDISEDGNFDKNDTKYNNTYGWLTLKSAINGFLSARTILYSGVISHDRNGLFHKYEPSDKGDFILTDKRDYSFLGIKQDWDLLASDKVAFQLGFDARQMKAKYDYFLELAELRADAHEVLYDYHRMTDIETNPSGQQIGAYISAKIKLAERLISETGARFDRSSYSGDNVISPRLSLAYAFGKNTFLRAAYGRYYQSQFINNLDVNYGVSEFNQAELATHYVIGFEHLLKNGINLRVEAYHKDMSGLAPLSQTMRDHLEIFPEQRNDYARVIYNGATSQGIEFFLKRDIGGKISWWFSYALAKAEDDVKEVEYEGLLIKRTGKVPRLNDQRHTVYADVNYRPNENWHFNFSWQFYRGWPRTDYTYNYQILPNGDYHFYPVHKEFNATIYPAYHRMDIRLNRKYKIKNGEIIAFLHLINIYNRKNLRKFDLDTQNDNDEFSIDENGNYVPFRDDKYWFSLMPVIGASWGF